jgi:uncharacterized protein
MLKRRQFLAAAAIGTLGCAGCSGLPVVGGIALWSARPEDGLFNPCLGSLPNELANHDLVLSAWEGLDPAKVWDCHAHLAGTGDSGSGIFVNRDMQRISSPVQYLQRKFYLNASCVRGARGGIDQRYIERLKELADGMRPGTKLMLLAYDQTYTENGKPDEHNTAFHVPNDYAYRVARAYPDHFEWVASVHPYRPDCVEAAENAARFGARAIKWLPAAQGMDPASPLCDRFFVALARLRLPLITHAGSERSVRGSQRNELGNPLRLRRALDHGVRVVVAHCASAGTDIDLDQGAAGPIIPSFDLFARLMDSPEWRDQLFGDISAITLINRPIGVLSALVERQEWHGRLLHGSDYPLPGVMPLVSIGRFVRHGLIDSATGLILGRIRRYNSLLFDFLLKRSLSLNGKKFAAATFETRAVFDLKS